jgi:hypothetical protein
MSSGIKYYQIYILLRRTHMKKLFQLLVVFALILTIIGVAKNSPAWASSLTGVESGGANSPLPTRIIITGNGNYNVGGVCTLDIEFKSTSPLQVKADAEIPLVDSLKVPFSGEGELFRPGCHVVHVKEDKVIQELTSADGTAKICFGANPEMKMKIYYYLDKPFTANQVFIDLGGTLEDNGRLICASAPYTGVYMPAGKVEPHPDSVINGINLPIPVPGGGSVLAPSATTTITTSGTYAAGGICMLKIHYKVDGLSDTLHVEPPEFDTIAIPFADMPDLLYFPGCHVTHFRDARVKYVMTPPEGDWEICFAARPGKVMTIYYYEYEDPAHQYVNPAHLVGPWKPLVTTTENGLACAPGVDFTAVYTPAGH